MKKKRRERRGEGSLGILFVILILFIGFGVLFIKYHLKPTEAPPPPVPVVVPTPTPSLPKVAIIIDDFGYSLSSNVKGLIELNYPITLAILPRLSHSSDTALLAELAGKEVILHLPMEPHSYKRGGTNPGEGAIFYNLSEQEIRERVRENLEDIPQAVGLNNHMGSRATESRRVMSAILDESKRRNLYFVDSLTSSNSVGWMVAREKGIKTAARDIFLDGKDDPLYINDQFDKLILRAKEKGSALAIGHVHSKSTLDVLRERLPRLEEEGVRLVFASEIVK